MARVRNSSKTLFRQLRRTAQEHAKDVGKNLANMFTACSLIDHRIPAHRAPGAATPSEHPRHAPPTTHETRSRSPADPDCACHQRIECDKGDRAGFLSAKAYSVFHDCAEQKVNTCFSLTKIPLNDCRFYLRSRVFCPTLFISTTGHEAPTEKESVDESGNDHSEPR